MKVCGRNVTNCEDFLSRGFASVHKTTGQMVCLGGLPVRYSTNDSSTMSFHSNSILMVSGQSKLRLNHMCIEFWLCPLQ